MRCAKQGITEVCGKGEGALVRQSPALVRQDPRHGFLPLAGDEIDGEAIGYDDKITRALYKALQATGM